MSIWYEVLENDDTDNEFYTLAFVRWESIAKKMCDGFSCQERIYRPVKQTCTWTWMTLTDYKLHNKKAEYAKDLL